jgi:TIR domain
MLFISHSSSDVGTVQALVDLIRAALALPPRQLRCTSLDGYRLEGGADIDHKLRQEVHQAEAFVGLISHRSLRSMYVAFELGARWGAEMQLIPLLAPGVEPTILKPPLSALNALSCGVPAQLQQLLEELSDALHIPLLPASSYQHEFERVLQLRDIPGRGLIPNHLARELELDYAARKSWLPDSQREILEFLEAQSKWRDSVPQETLELEFDRVHRCTYWRLEALCFLGFVDKEVTNRRAGFPTYNYRLTPEYKHWAIG